ncbi:MAG: hypothetical protein EA397_15155 [Deltaproteobacteria bacterium]|nr:MAG: hypothetical protein EA397_15155 [Deltaproteobacteria bacterium]
MVLSLLLLTAPQAHADQPRMYASEVIELEFGDYFNAFEAIDYDTGSLPSGSPLAVRFFIRSFGGSHAEFLSESHLTWPDALTQQIVGVPGTGILDLDSRIDLAAQVSFDLWGIAGSYDVWSERIVLERQRTFDPDLLADGTPSSLEMVADGDGLIRPFTVGVPLIAGLELEFRVQVFPRATTFLSGYHYETEGQIADQTAQEVMHEIPRNNRGRLRLVTRYVADVGASLSLIVQPTMAVCHSWFGCYSVATFDIPIHMVNDVVQHTFGPRVYEHPLPALESTVTWHDYGEIPVETLSNLQLPLTNLGQLPLEGWMEIEGDDSFSVFPPYFYATEGNTSGAVVTFDPREPGPKAATLIIESNDPRDPILRVPLSGTGWVEPDPEEPPVEVPRLSGEVGCGCSSTTSAGSSSVLALLLSLVLLRRRRR